MGYPVSQTTWKAPSLTDKLSLKLEPQNKEDPHAAAVIRQSEGDFPPCLYQSRRHYAGETTLNYTKVR